MAKRVLKITYQGPPHAGLTVGKRYVVQGFLSHSFGYGEMIGIGGTVRCIVVDDDGHLFRTCDTGPQNPYWSLYDGAKMNDED